MVSWYLVLSGLNHVLEQIDHGMVVIPKASKFWCYLHRAICQNDDKTKKTRIFG
jgi:hypothetical protein